MKEEIERLRKNAVLYIINIGLLDRAVEGCDEEILKMVNRVFSHSFKFSADDFSYLLLSEIRENVEITLDKVIDKIERQKDIKEKTVKGLFVSSNNGNEVVDEEYVVQYGVMQVEQLETLRNNLEDRKNEIEKMLNLKKQ